MLAVDVALRRGSLDLAVNLEVAAGETLALVGPSGAGKSTLLRIIAGLTPPDGGSIALGDDVWLDPRAGLQVAAERRRVGFVFQDYALFPGMSARRNVAYGARGSRSERGRRATELLGRFGLADRAGARPSQLSGGERQRVALARAMASDPRLLLLDEPLSALDARTRASASGLLAELLGAEPIPSVIVTHDFAEAAALADRVAVLDDGRVVQVGTAAELASAPASAFVADLAGAVVLAGFASPGTGGLTRVALDGGGEIRSTDSASGPVAVSVFPWEIELVPASGAAGDPESSGSALNSVAAEVTRVTTLGNRARVTLSAPQPVIAEITGASVERLGIAPGSRVEARWKATATRLLRA